MKDDKEENKATNAAMGAAAVLGSVATTLVGAGYGITKLIKKNKNNKK